MAQPPRSLPRPPRLTLRFAVYAGVALALAGGASVWVASRHATIEAERNVWSDAEYVAERLGRDDLARSALEEPVAGDLRAELDELFDREALGPQASRITLFRRDGRVTYSTDHQVIGTVHPDARAIERALAGEQVSGIVENEGERTIESYVALRWVLADPTWPAGVLRVSRDYEPVAQAIRDDVRIQAATILLALLFLYLATFPILRKVTNDLAARNRSLAESESRWRVLTEQASDAILVLDGDAVVLDANDRARQLTGRAAEEIVGRSVAELLDPDELTRMPLRLAELHEGEIVVTERRLLRPDGSTALGELSSRLLDDGRILVSVRDVTQRKELENERRRALRAEATERLAAGIAHDFDRVLGSLASAVQHLHDRLPGADRAVARVQEAVEVGGELTAQLRAFGRRRHGEAQIVDVEQALAGMEASLRGLAGEAIEIVTAVAPGLGRVQADPNELRQLLSELVLNACDSMPRGGTLTVSAENVDFGRRRREPASDARVRPGRYVMLAVADTGGGEAGGDDRVALGLATVFALVHRTGGTIGVESDPGRGTTVRVYLPWAAAEAGAGAPALALAPAADLAGSETVLVAEDEQIVRAVVREILEERGYTVLEAASGVEALEVAAAHEGAIDVLVTDVVMPDLGGFALAEELAKRRPACRVVFMSGYSEGPRDPELVFLEKPFTHESLARTVRGVLDRAA